MRWRLKSPTLPLLTQPLIEAQIKEKQSKLRVTGLCAGNSPMAGIFPAQMASNAEMVLFDDVIMIRYTLNKLCWRGSEMEIWVGFCVIVGSFCER